VFLQLVANGLVLGSVLAIAAVGVSLIYGILGFVNFAYGDVMVFGAFVAVLCNVRWGLPMALSGAAAMVATAVLCVALEGVLWRPVRARRGGFMSLFLASIGLALVLREAIFLVAGPQPRSYDVDPYKVYVIGSVRLSGSQAVAIVVAAVAIVLVGLMLGSSSAGRKMRAVADDRALAAVAGIDTRRVVFLTWAVCGLLAGLAGVLAALVQSSFDPNFGFTLLLPIFAAVVLGGIGSAYGALLGGLLLGLATELSTWPGFHGGVDPVYKPVVAFVVLIAVLLVRPRGLLGRAQTL
jgi:branched-subunit amino acid ABC-type transport system permease component